MNLILMRHGEATDNVKKLISDKEIYWSVLTDKGIKSVLESIEYLPDKIDKAYVSPLPRTVQTSSYVHEKYSNIEFVIEDRIREIKYGKYSHMKNNEELDLVRQKQINGDYFCRFGDTGENKYDIEMRLCSFLEELANTYKNDENILVITHGSISSYIKRLLNVKSSHLQTGKIEIFKEINFDSVFSNIKILKDLKK